MFTINQDYIIKNSDIPVLTRQTDGHFEPVDCYFLEFFVKTDAETLNNLKMIYNLFDFGTGIQLAISGHNKPNYVQRLFLLGSPDIIKNNFKEPDDFLTIALCDDRKKRTKIQYFEVNHDFRHTYEPNQKFIYVGTSAVNALKDIYKTRELYGKSAMEAVKFWVKNGFKPLNENNLYVYWKQR